MSRDRNVIASVGEVAMFFAISNFTAVKRAALCAARVAVGAPLTTNVTGQHRDLAVVSVADFIVEDDSSMLRDVRLYVRPRSI